MGAGPGAQIAPNESTISLPSTAALTPPWLPTARTESGGTSGVAAAPGAPPRECGRRPPCSRRERRPMDKVTRRRKEFGQAAGSTLGQYSCVGHVGSSVGRLGHAHPDLDSMQHGTAPNKCVPFATPTPPTQKTTPFRVQRALSVTKGTFLVLVLSLV